MVAYVDDGYEGLSAETAVAWPYDGNPGMGANIIGSNAFSTIQAAIGSVAAGGTIQVAPGTYIENVIVNKAVTLLGPNAGKSGSDPSRGPEAVIMPAVNDIDEGVIVDLESSGITLDGFLIDGDNPSLGGGFALDSADINVAECIQNAAWSLGPFAQISNTTIQNNWIRNGRYQSVYIEVDYQSNHSWNYIRSNRVENAWEGIQTYAWPVQITGNEFTNVNLGTSMHGGAAACDPGFAPCISDNRIEIGPALNWRMTRSRTAGVWINFRLGEAPPLVVSNNVVNTPYPPPIGKYIMAFFCLTVDEGREVQFLDNWVNGQGNCGRAFYAIGCGSSSTVRISGGQLNGIAGDAILVSSSDPSWGNADVQCYVTNTVVNLSGSGAGLVVKAMAGMQDARLTVEGNVVVHGPGGTGARLMGPRAEIVSLSPGALELDANLANYFVLSHAAGTGNWTEWDATAVLFGGKTGSAMTDVELYSTEDKIQHRIDDDAVGFVRVKPGHGYVTQTSGAGGIGRGIGALAAGDTLKVADGAYTEGPQLVVSKNLSVVGQSRAGVVITPSDDTGSEGDSAGWWLIEAGRALVLHDLTLDGTGRRVSQALRFKGAGTVENVRFAHLRFEESGPAYSGVGAAADAGAEVHVSVVCFRGYGAGRRFLFWRQCRGFICGEYIYGQRAWELARLRGRSRRWRRGGGFEQPGFGQPGNLTGGRNPVGSRVRERPTGRRHPDETRG